METRGVLPSLRTVAAPADCIRPRTGNGRNRYVPAASACRGSVVNRYARAPAGAAGRDGLTWHGYYPAVLFFGLFSQFHDYNRNVISLRRHSANGKVRLLRSCELIRPKLLCPFVEFHKAIFGVGGWDPYSLPRFSNLLRSSYKQPRHAGKETGADASAVSLYAAVRSFVPMLVRPFGHGRNRDVSTGYAAQNNNPRLSDVANKSCLKGRPLKIWSCCPAPYGNGTHVCAALTGGRIIAAPFFAKNPISLYSRSDGRETLNRRSAHHKHKIAKGSNPTGGGTAVTNPTSRTGGTELRLFHFWDLSLAPPANRNTYRSKEPPRRMR